MAARQEADFQVESRHSGIGFSFPRQKKSASSFSQESLTDFGKTMSNVPQAEPKSQETISDAEFNRRYSECKVAPDVAQQIFALAGVPPRARDVLLALRVILRPGETRKVSRAAMAKRLNRDDTTASRHLDALQKYQQESGFQFVILERCRRHEKKSPIITDIWDALLRCALRTAVKAGAELNVWEKGAGVAQPAILAREAVAQKVFDKIPHQKPETKTLTPEEQAKAREEQARTQVARAETRSRDLFADLEKHAEIVPFAVIAELARLEKLIPQLLAKTNRRAQDFAFAERFGSAEREEGVVIHVAENETEAEGVPDPDMCILHMSDEANKDVEADPFNNFWEPPTDEGRLDAVLHYARLGRRIVPIYGLTPEGHCQCKKGAECRSAGKHPRIADWVNQATTDEDQIRKWWGRWRDSNIGWAMGGEAGFLALDFDDKPGEAIYEELKTKGLIPPTVEQKTGSGGRQVIFRDAPNLKNEVRIAPGLDIRSQGGQVVIPPSVSGKGPYFWRTDLSEPAVLPRDLFEWIQGKLLDQEEARLVESPQKRDSVTTFFSKGVSLPSVILEGTRNRDLFGYGCGLRNSGANREQILDALIDKNHLCSPPLPLDEIRDIAASCCRYQPAQV